MTQREELLALFRHLRTERGPTVVKLRGEVPEPVPEDMQKYVVGSALSVEFTRANDRGVVFLFDNDGNLTSIDAYDLRQSDVPIRLARLSDTDDNEEVNEMFEHVLDVAASGVDISPEDIANQMVVQGERLAHARGKRLTPDMIRLVARAHAEQARRMVAELERIAREREGH